MDERDQLLTIGVFARRSRLSVKALRLYEGNGILRPESVDELNGYRRYGESQLRDARLVRLLRRLDMPLTQVAQVLSAPREQRTELVHQYWSAVEHRVAQQGQVAGLLQNVLSGGKESYPMYEIKTREVPEQTILTEQRHVTAEHLPAWIGEAGERQQEALVKVGGPFGPSLVIYHGDVNEDSDGPAEVCSPLPADVAASLDFPSRVEPAHREAYTTITKAQVRFPDIVSAYDAVENWITQKGEQISGSCREVYFTDFMAAADDDEVCDIAFPIASR